MTHRTWGDHARFAVIWPEQDDGDDYHYEHASGLRRSPDGVSIQQRDQEITVPLYAVRALLRELRDIAKPTEGA